MKKSIHKTFSLIMAAAMLLPFFQPQQAAAATGTLSVENKIDSANQKTFSFTVPATTDLASVTYSGRGTMVSKNITGTTLTVTIAGESFTETVTASEDSYGDDLVIIPGNRIWRYADGTRWQINTINKSNRVPVSYNVTGIDKGGGVPFEYPGSNISITTYVNYSTAMAMQNDKQWVGDTTGMVYAYTDIDFTNWTMKSATPDTSSETIYPSNAVTFERHSDGYYVYVDHLIHHENQFEINDEPPSSVPKGQHVLGLNYAAPFVYSLAAQTKTVYQYGGTITYTANEPVDPCKENPTASGCTQTYTVTGDFDIVPAEIEYRQSFSFQPKNFNIPAACTYQNHRYIIRRDGDSSLSNTVTNRNQTTSYTYATYPNVIGVGIHEVSLKIRAVCNGTTIETDWIATKTLIVNGPTNNGPPVFDAGFFREPDLSSFDPLTMVAINSTLNLRIINDPRTEPAKPYDPDGDPITYYWDFAGSDSAWIRSFPSAYHALPDDDRHRYLKATALGLHCIHVTARDPHGASTTKKVCIEVVPENPIPVIDGPVSVVEGRPLPSQFSGSRSFSPIGRQITQYIWGNLQSTYNVPGTEQITLEVIDSGGLRSRPEDMALHQLIVKPDEPPIPRLDFLDVAVRNMNVHFANTSYSPDGDEIVLNTVNYKYDRNNNGLFDDEISQPVIMDADGTFTFVPTAVGQYQFCVFVKEDWGKTASACFMLSVVNDNPSASYTVTGQIDRPPVDPPEPITPTQMTGSSWQTMSADGGMPKKWYAIGDTIQNGHYLGKFKNSAYPWPYNVPFDNITNRTLTNDDMMQALLGEDITIEADPAVKSYFIKRNGQVINQIRKEAQFANDPDYHWRFDHMYVYFYRSFGTASAGQCSDGWAYHYYVVSIYNLTQDASQERTWPECHKGHGLFFGHFFGYPKVHIYYYDGLYKMTEELRTSYTLSKQVDDTVIWSVTESTISNIGYYHRDQTAFAVSADAKRMAHMSIGNVLTGNYGNEVDQYLTIRDNDTGALIRQVHLGLLKNALGVPNPNIKRLVGSYQDIIILLENHYFTMYAYDFDGNLLWQVPASQLGYYNGNFNLIAISKDGYIPYLSASRSGYGFRSGTSEIYLNYLNVVTGQVEKQIQMDSYTTSNTYDRIEFTFHRPYLLDDGKMAVGYTVENHKSGDIYKQRFEYVVEGTQRVESPKQQGPFYGQFYDPLKNIADAELSYSLLFHDTELYRANEHAGLSFHIRDAATMYRVESNRYRTTLVKLENGVRSVIQTANFPMSEGTWYAFKVRFAGTKIKVYASGIPIIDVDDASITGPGSFGIYSTKENVAFKSLMVQTYPDPDNMPNVALVDRPVTYAATYADPEHDPQSLPLTRWTFSHVNPNKFLDAGDGKSGLSTNHNQTYTSPILQFDRVGLFKVDYQATDDPHPNYLYPSNVFGDYRQPSNVYRQNVVVHRRPVAKFTLSISPTDHTVIWNDESYDPDRWLGPGNFSTENTGINYETTRGILERKYYYLSPTGAYGTSKLVAPGETGTYTVGMAVKDEYGAWSDWEEAQIAITVPIVDDPPIPGFTLSKTTLYRGETLSITSTASDKEDGPAANLAHEYFIRNVTAGGPETPVSTSRGTWTRSFSELGQYAIRQVVCDSKGQCAQAAKSIVVVNRAPLAAFDWSPKRVYEGDHIAIVNQSVDPDGDVMTFVWTVTGPGGYTQTASTRDIDIPAVMTANRPGVFVVTLTVRDLSGSVHAVTHAIVVHELGIQGMVRHTEAWEANRLRYNDKYPQFARPPDWFWTGEAFELSAIVTDTSESATVAIEVEATAPPSLRKSLAADGTGILWQGRLRSMDAGFPLDELPQGPLTFTFTVRYSNGMVKTAYVTVQLKDTVDHFVQVHRVQ